MHIKFDSQRIAVFFAILILSTLSVKAKLVSQQAWQGQSQGYLVETDPTKHDAAFMVSLGRVLAAIGRANHYEKEVGMSNPFTDEVLAEYALIDPVVSGQSSISLSLQPLLSKVASNESFAMIIDKTSSKRKQRNAIHENMKNLILRVDAIITERAPSTKASALAMSAMFREAGELLRNALSSNGEIVNFTQYRDSIELMEAALRLRVRKVSSCPRSSDAIKQLKSNGPMGNLLDKLIIGAQSGKVNGNPGDVFAAARKLELLGNSLPDDEREICP